ncbi:MAG: energy transducer TonB [Sphingomicrobium sp.]
MDDPHRDRPHRLSPVQPGRNISVVPFLAMSVVAAALFWGFQQQDVEEPNSAPDRAGAIERPRPEPPDIPPPVTAGSSSAPPRGKILGPFSDSDYPEAAIENEEEGSVTVRVNVDRGGTVTRCNVIESSGHPLLDQTTCKIVRDRARFTPARDENGDPIEGSLTQRVVWRLQ